MKILGLRLPYFNGKGNGGSGGNPSTVIDDLGNATLALSVRRVISTYTGSCMRIRRASDNAEQDIGFDGVGDLNTAAITSFCGASAGFVVTWYDQSPSGVDVTQSTTSNQPSIYDGVSIRMSAGKPAVFFTGDDASTANNSFLQAAAVPVLTDTASTDRPYLWYVVHQIPTFIDQTAALNVNTLITIFGGADDLIRISHSAASTTNMVLESNNNPFNTNATPQTYPDNSTYIMGYHESALSNTQVYYWKGTAFRTVTTGQVDTDVFYANLTTTTLGRGAVATRNMHGYINEVIMFDGNKIGSKTTLETYIENYYTIDP